MQDKYNRELKIGDECVYNKKGFRVSILSICKITDFTPAMVEVQLYDALGIRKRLKPYSLIKLSTEGLDWVSKGLQTN